MSNKIVIQVWTNSYNKFLVDKSITFNGLGDNIRGAIALHQLSKK